jgi:hypothetical protein
LDLRAELPISRIWRAWGNVRAEFNQRHRLVDPRFLLHLSWYEQHEDIKILAPILELDTMPELQGSTLANRSADVP